MTCHSQQSLEHHFHFTLVLLLLLLLLVVVVLLVLTERAQVTCFSSLLFSGAQNEQKVNISRGSDWIEEADCCEQASQMCQQPRMERAPR